MRVLFAGLIFILAGCNATTHTSQHTCSHDQPLNANTMEIIRSAAESAPAGVPGEYLLNIKATGTEGPRVYLNTELDYRDQRSVTVALHPQVVAEFNTKFGARPETFFIGKKIRVKGSAQRIRVDLINAMQQPSGKYYYQTHIRVVNIAQIEIVNEQA